jgi:hypothetical protein
VINTELEKIKKITEVGKLIKDYIKDLKSLGAGRFGKKMDLSNWSCRIDIMPKWYCRFGKTLEQLMYIIIISV